MTFRPDPNGLLVLQNLIMIPPVNSTLVATTASNNVQLQGDGNVVLIKNIGAFEAFVACGTSSAVTATAGQSASTTSADGSFSIPVGEIGIYRLPYGTTYIAAITASGSTVLRISQGFGQ